MPPKNPLKTAAEIAAERLAAAPTAAAPAAPLQTAAQRAMGSAAGIPAIPGNVQPGGVITAGEFNAGGARPNTYNLFDPKGAANLRAAGQAMGQAYQGGYVPGQYTGSMSVPAAAAPAAPAPPTFPNQAGVRPSVVAPNDLAPAASNAAANSGRAAGVGSKLLGAAQTMTRMGSMATPFLGDVAQGVIYGAQKGSVGRGLMAGLGSFTGRTIGTSAGRLGGPVTAAAGNVTGSFAGGYGGAKLYDALTESQTEPVNEAAEFQKRKDMQSGDSPELRAARAQQTPAQLAERAEEARRDTRSNYPSYFEPAASRLDPVVMKKDPAPAKPAAPKGEFQGPSAEEKARFRKQTGTPYDPKSITDKLNLERMRAGEQTFTSKQSREFRRANPTYRPGQYVKRGQ
jgi:hypothetical protein